MKAKLKNGGHLLFSEGCSNRWNSLGEEMIINFAEKYTYKDYTLLKNRLTVRTIFGIVDIVFTGTPPKALLFVGYEKNQLILKIVK